MLTEGDKRPRSSAGPISVLFRSLPERPVLTLNDRRELRQFARALSQDVATGATFTCLITNDRELRDLNRTFLKHDWATDVLSFPTAGRKGEMGEIAISIERAHAQAVEHGHGWLEEVRILMLHGVLHLTGLDHERDRGEMARAERRWRGVFELPSGLIARSRHTQEAGAR